MLFQLRSHPGCVLDDRDAHEPNTKNESLENTMSFKPCKLRKAVTHALALSSMVSFGALAQTNEAAEDESLVEKIPIQRIKSLFKDNKN